MVATLFVIQSLDSKNNKADRKHPCRTPPRSISKSSVSFPTRAFHALIPGLYQVYNLLLDHLFIKFIILC